MKVEEYQRAELKLYEWVLLVFEARRRAEEEQEEHQQARLNAEDEARLVEKVRLKSDEEDLQLKSKDEDRLVEEAKLKA